MCVTSPPSLPLSLSPPDSSPLATAAAALSTRLSSACNRSATHGIGRFWLSVVLVLESCGLLRWLRASPMRTPHHASSPRGLNPAGAAPPSTDSLSCSMLQVGGGFRRRRSETPESEATGVKESKALLLKPPNSPLFAEMDASQSMQRALRTLSPQTPRPGGLQLGKKP
ncbi:hypothetical protein THAOC_27887, partial [Thalassiosira oceanica]